ncbi:MAG: prohibitin family protein [Proteobacteria bacterium]|nr:prohibitin family protein [Pseudomonadota bacterium]
MTNKISVLTKGISVALVLIFSTLTLTSCTNPHTPAGNEGYVYEDPRIFGKGGHRGVVSGPGNYGVSLWRNKIINIDVRPATYTEKFKILAKDDLNVSFNFHAVISVNKGGVAEVVQNFGGENWYNRFIREPYRTFVRDAVQKYTSRDIKATREIIASDVERKLTEHLKGSPFKLVSLVVGDINYPDIVAQAVEKKLAAQQLLEEKSVQKQIAQKDAEIKVEEAKGIAQAQKIINETLTVNYLQHEAIMAQERMANSPNHTTVYIPSGSNGIPIVYTPKN